MRDRLIDLLYDSDLSLDSVRLADHLLANGVIAPPCKVGDIIYNTCRVYSRAQGHHIAIRSREVRSIYYVSNRGIRPWTVDCYGGYAFDNLDFGKTVFLTREEAEKALKEAEG